MGLDIVQSAKRVEEVTHEQLKSWFNRLSKDKRKKLSSDDKVLELINASINDPAFDGFKFIDTLITYQTALEGTRASLKDYVNAIRFCGFLEANEGNTIDAYVKAFSHREFVRQRVGCDTSSTEYKDLCAAATRYKKTPLVVNILSQAEVPLYLMFQGYRYKAVARLAKEMEEAPLPRDRINAADKLLLHVKPPEGLKVEVDVSTAKEDVIDMYTDVMNKLVAQKKQLIMKGADIEEVTNISPVRDVEVIE